MAKAVAHPVASAFVIALVIRVGIAVFLTQFFSGTLVLDDTTYHGMIVSMASGETQNWDDFTHTLYWSTAGLTAPVTVLYKVFGPHMVVGQLYVALTGAVAVAAASRLAMEVVSRGWALAIGLVLALLPSQAFWSSMLMKDAPVWMALTTLALVIAVAGRSTGRRLVLLGIAAALVLTVVGYLRLHTLVVASFALMVAGFMGIKEQRVPRILGAIAIGVGVPWFIGGIGPAGVDLVLNAGSLEDRRFANAQGANTAIVDVPSAETPEPEPAPDLEPRLDEVVETRERLEARTAALEARLETAVTTPGTPDEGGGATPKERRIERRVAQLEARIQALDAFALRLREELSEIGGQVDEQGDDEPAPPAVAEDEGGLDTDLTHLPRGISVMLLEPFPVPFEGSLSLRLARAEAIAWYPLLLLAIVGLAMSWRHLRVLAFPLVAGTGIVIMYALTEGNIGTAHRHRGEFVWVVVILAGMGLSERARRRMDAGVVGATDRPTDL